MNKTTNRLRVCTIVAALGLLQGVASANIMGTLGIGGQVVISGVGAAGQIAFSQLAHPPATGPGDTFVITGGTGFFTPTIPNGTGPSTGFGVESPNLTAASMPIDTPISVMNFLTFDGVPNLSFELTMVLGGVDGPGGCSASPAAGGQHCSPPGTPFNLDNLSASTSSAQFVILGKWHAPDGSITPGKGVFSASNVNGTFQDLLFQVNSGQSVTVSYGAQFSTIPEPNLGFLSGAVGFGFLALGMVGKRKMKKNI